jgi:lipocalin
MCNSATAFSLTLDSGKVDGQIKKFVNLNTNAAGIVTITPIAFGQGSTIALKAKGTIELNWYSGKWYSMQDSSTFFTIN